MPFNPWGESRNADAKRRKNESRASAEQAADAPSASPAKEPATVDDGWGDWDGGPAAHEDDDWADWGDETRDAAESETRTGGDDDGWGDWDAEPQDDAGTQPADDDDWGSWGDEAGTAEPQADDTAAEPERPEESRADDGWDGWGDEPDAADEPAEVEPPEEPQADNDDDDRKSRPGDTTTETGMSEDSEADDGWDDWDAEPAEAETSEEPRTDDDDWGSWGDEAEASEDPKAEATEPETDDDDWGDWGDEPETETADDGWETAPQDDAEKPGAFRSAWRDHIGDESAGEGVFDWDGDEDPAPDMEDKAEPEAGNDWGEAREDESGIDSEWADDEAGDDRDGSALPLKRIMLGVGALVLIAAVIMGVLQWRRMEADKAAQREHDAACATLKADVSAYRRLMKTLTGLGVDVDDVDDADCSKSTAWIEKADGGIDIKALSAKLTKTLADKWAKEGKTAVDKAVAVNPAASQTTLDQLKALLKETPKTVRERESLDARLKQLSDKAASEQAKADKEKADKQAEEQRKAEEEARRQAEEQAQAQAEAQAQAQSQAQSQQSTPSYTPHRSVTGGTASTPNTTPAPAPTATATPNPGNAGAEM